MRGETSRSYENVYTKIEGVNPNKKGSEPKRRTKKKKKTKQFPGHLAKKKK